MIPILKSYRSHDILDIKFWVILPEEIDNGKQIKIKNSRRLDAILAASNCMSYINWFCVQQLDAEVTH